MLQDQRSFKFIDDEVFNKMDRLLDMADSVSLVIDGFEKGMFHSKLIVNRRGKSLRIECPVEKGLAVVAARGGIIIRTAEKSL